MTFCEWFASDECINNRFIDVESDFIDGARYGWDAAMKQNQFWMEQQNKPAPKVKMWRWLVKTDTGCIFITNYYSSEGDVRNNVPGVHRMQKIDFGDEE